MTVPGSVNPLLLRKDTGYSISRSLRFNSSDSAYCSKNFSAGNRKTWTLSFWTKLNQQTIEYARLLESFGSYASNRAGVVIYANSFSFYNLTGGAVTAELYSAQVFRDYSAWYHIVIAVDTTNATAGNRVRLFVNGVRVSFTGTNPGLNEDLQINAAQDHFLCALAPTSGYGYHFNGYLADIWFVNGLVPATTTRTVNGVTETVLSDFGEFDATSGVWNPKAYTGSATGTSFHLEFADNSAATATTLGKDTSGISPANNWTPNNLSVTAGAGNDSLVDVPTNGSQTDTGVGGEVRGNYATLNPLDSALTGLNNGNLQSGTSAAANWKHCRATFAMNSGKWYWEYVVPGTPDASNGYQMGVLTAATSLTQDPNSSSTGFYTRQHTSKYANGTNTTPFASLSSNDIVMFAFDADSGKLWTGQNGTWYNSGSPANGTNESWSSVPAGVFPMAGSYGSSLSVTVNFGARSFAYTAPSGFKALCTTNLPIVITKPNTVMDVLTWTGTGGGRTLSGLGFSPDLVWGKSRSAAYNHQLYDVVRGAGNANDLSSSLTAAEGSATVAASAYGYLSAFTSDGFTVANGTDGSLPGAYWNASGTTYAAWCWDAGSSTVTNTQGSITSSVRANATAGFSIVTFNSGSGAPTDYTVGHGLNVAPQFIIAKSRTSASFSWVVYHTSIATTTKKYLSLNSTAATSDNGTNIWGAAQPTSTVFGITSGNGVVANTDCIAYCFAPVVGYANAFSYTGNGSSDGPMVWLGFRPRFILLKRTDTTASWTMRDTARDTYNISQYELQANSSAAEASASNHMDILSNGFKLRSSDAWYNASGGTYVGFAWAESPFNYARAR